MLRAFVTLAVLTVLLTGQTTTQASDDGQATEQFDLLIRQGRISEASQNLESYTAAHADSWRALYQLGYIYFRLHRIHPSLNMLSKSLAIYSGFAEAHKILAFDLNILGRKDLAISELQKAIALDPASWESRYELGRIYFERGSYLQAVEQFEKVKLLAPEFVKTYHNAGLAYNAIGDRDKAVQNFDEGLRLNAGQKQPSAWPLIDYATYFNLQSDFGRARDLLVAAIKIDGSWAQEFEELAKAYRGLGEVRQAIENLQKANSINPHKVENHYVLARLYTQTHQPEEARRELTEYDKDRQRTAARQP